MRKEEPTLRLTGGEPLTVLKHLLIYCRNRIETRSNLGIPDNLYEALSPNEENSNQIILFLKYINMYNSI